MSLEYCPKCNKNVQVETIHFDNNSYEHKCKICGLIKVVKYSYKEEKVNHGN